MIASLLHQQMQLDVTLCGAGRKYVSFADYVLQYGTLFKLSTTPGQTLTRCAAHHTHIHEFCMNVCLRTEGYHYVEGFVVHQGVLFPHVWVIDNQGSAFDLCLDMNPQTEYYGLEVSLSLVRQRKWTGVFDMRTEARKGFPILTGTISAKADNAWF